jgi:hypothetical protein
MPPTSSPSTAVPRYESHREPGAAECGAGRGWQRVARAMAVHRSSSFN